MHQDSADNSLHTAPLIHDDGLPAIGILPPELLIQIFTYCVSEQPLSPLILRGVCKWWCAIVDTSPRLWQTIPLNDAYGERLSKQHAALWTARSEPLKYDITLNVIDSQSILPLLSPLFSSIDRWRSFRFSGGGSDGELLPPRESPFTLTHLHICLLDTDTMEWEDDESKIAFAPLDQFSSFAMNMWISKIPSPTLLPPLLFVHVTITEGGPGGIHTQPGEILAFLTACPNIEYFALFGFPQTTPLNDQLPVVHLANLLTLHIKSVCYAREIFSSIDAPRLQNLYLSMLNVEFDIETHYQEAGDSEDEAQDFSQSPSSDKASGMGLRALLDRCSPPIQVLDMDFCDMRTKDFRYVFDRLPHLQEFRIVASDMSDKVINLLRPYSSSSSGKEALRLPNLRTLNLINCQRLTGSAIVGSLTERVQWTVKEGLVDKLQEVFITGCDGFKDRDRNNLSIALGHRLQP